MDIVKTLKRRYICDNRSTEICFLKTKTMGSVSDSLQYRRIVKVHCIDTYTDICDIPNTIYYELMKYLRGDGK